jgi:glycogen operon protein
MTQIKKKRAIEMEKKMLATEDPIRVYPGDPMRDGVRRDGDRVCFTMRVPENKNLELLLYKKNETKPARRIPYPPSGRIGNISSISIYVDPETAWYNYCVDGEIVPDPYAVSVKPYKVGGKTHLLCAIPTDYIAETEPLDTKYCDSVFYKLNVRGYTKHRAEGVSHPGTFLGVKERIPELKKLGVTALILMPVYEFSQPEATESSYMLDSDVRVKNVEIKERKNFWGYSDGLYFAPKADYSFSDDPVTEFGDLVDSLHRNGLECILEFYFDRKSDPRVVTDALRYWRFVFHVDGFHLVGDGSWIDAVTADPMLVSSKLIYTYFNTDAIYGGKKPSGCNLADMNLGYEHTMRRFLKGDTDVSVSEVSSAMLNDSNSCAKISFFADQDGFTMNDMVSYNEKHNEANGDQNKDGTTENYSWNCGVEGPSRKSSVRKLRIHQLRNAFLMLMVGQAAPMIYAGDEVMNTQEGNNNAWCQDNTIGWVSWSRSKDAAELNDYVRQCISFRKKHPVLHPEKLYRMSDYKSCGFPDLSYHSKIAWMSGTGETKNGFAAMYCGRYADKPDGTKDDTIYIAYNMYWRPQTFALPQLPQGMQWKVKADTSRNEVFLSDGEEEVLKRGEDKNVSVRERSIVILIAEKTGIPKKKEKSGKAEE